MPEQDEVKLPPIPGHMHLRAESPVALSSESITAMLHSYGKQCYEAGVLAERERVIKACRDLNAATDGRARGQDYVDAILGDWDGAVMRIFHRVGKGTP